MRPRRVAFAAVPLSFFLAASALAEAPGRGAPVLDTAPALEPAPEGEDVHRIVDLEHALLPEDREELARLGVEIVQPLASRRVIVRGAPSSLEALAASGVAARVAPIEPSDRLHGTAVAQLLRSGGAARLEVVFHADV
ncbi:MAG TPA: hypothetical protein VLV48_10720, partial [Thermoanaerobaculia bacterium]|nr:hypothetical protein [Thermoanaerobaculia bacterium]